MTSLFLLVSIKISLLLIFLNSEFASGSKSALNISNCNSISRINLVQHVDENIEFGYNDQKKFPWIEQTFPECWHTFQQLFFHNDSSQFIKCQKSCWKLYMSCGMLDLFPSTQTCINLKRMSSYCTELENSDCVNKKAGELQAPQICSSILLASNTEHNWVIKWIENKSRTTKGCTLRCGSSSSWAYIGEMYEVDVPIILFGTIGMVVSFFTIMSFLIDWKCQRRYPAIILFILNACIFTCYMGWLIQYFGTGKAIACNSHEERRYGEPKTLSSIWCMLSFIFIYFSSVAIACWFVVLNYAWYLSFHTMKEIRIVIQNKVKYFHLLSWGTSVLLTLMILLLGEVDAHPLTNICYVASRNPFIRDIFILCPFFIAFLIGEGLLVANIYQLRILRTRCGKLDVQKAVSNISRTIYRMIAYGTAVFVAWSTIFFCLLQEIHIQKSHDEQFSSHIRCLIEQMNFRPSSKCKPPARTRLRNLHLQFMSFFLISMVTSSWTWTRATIRIWSKVWKRLRHGVDEKERQQRSWFLRNNRKKIRPFVPPIDPNNPFENIPLNFRMARASLIKRNSLPDLHGTQILKSSRMCRRRSSGDLRSVVELFSTYRNVGSMEDIIKPSTGNKRIFEADMSLRSLQSYGHLKTAHDFENSSSNLKLVCGKNLNEPKMSTASFEELLQVRDELYTPLSLAHKGNIVADCIPYNRIIVTPSVASLDLDHAFVCLKATTKSQQIDDSILDILSLPSTEII